MPYIQVSGQFNISAESWRFNMYLYTNLNDVDDIRMEELYARVARHVEIYWRDSFSALISEPAYSFQLIDYEIVSGAPEEVNRVQAYTEYYVMGSSAAGQHPVGYAVDVFSNIQIQEWTGGYRSVGKKIPAWLVQQGNFPDWLI